MIRGLLGAILVAVLSGCHAYCELERDLDPGTLKAQIKIDGDEKPIATVFVCNVCYKLFGVIPWCTGVTWKDGSFADYDQSQLKFFQDQCTLDNNLASVHAALRECGSNRICNLINTSTTESGWSLYLLSRKCIKTTCVILEPKNGKSDGK